MKPPTIVVADDDPQIVRIVTRNLQLEGYDVLTASDGEIAVEQITTHAPDLVLLDVIMPKRDGFSVCECVRAFSAVPIIMMTARGREHDKVHGLDLGADDSLTKPFRLDELLARLRAVLRRTLFNSRVATPTFQITTKRGELTIDHVQHQVKVEDKEIVLTLLEYNLLSDLAQHAGRLLTQMQLLDQIWGAEYVGENHLLQVLVCIIWACPNWNGFTHIFPLLVPVAFGIGIATGLSALVYHWLVLPMSHELRAWQLASHH